MLTLDEENLVRLFQELDPKRRAQATKGALRRAANLVKKEAVKNLKSSKNGKGKNINTASGLQKGIRRLIYRKTMGFRVTVGTARRGKSDKAFIYGYHQGRGYRRAMARGVRKGFLTSYEKPVLIWAEDGTDDRSTKSRGRKKGHFTGSMPRYGFMERTKVQMKDKVTDLLHKEINYSIQRIAKKYGCRVT